MTPGPKDPESFLAQPARDRQGAQSNDWRRAMADKAKRVDYYSIEIPDQPGEAFRILAKFKESGVNFLSITGFPASVLGKGQISLMPENGESFLKAAKTVGVAVGAAKKAFLVQGSDRVGAAAETFKKLADAKINMRAYNAGSSQGNFGLVIWVAAEDVDVAAKALGT